MSGRRVKVRRPVLRYHGGKWRLAPWIIAHFPAHRVYVEPFGGAASVLLRKQRSYAEVYNDMDGEIVNLFRVLRDRSQAAELVRLVGLTPFAREEFRQSYLPADDPVERARRLVFRSFAGYGSGLNARYGTGFRNDTKKTGTTPARDWSRMPAHLGSVIERLQGVVIEQAPAFDLLRIFDSKETLFYCDPPYVHGTRNNRHIGDAYRYEMTDEDHRAMAALLHGLGGMVVLSGYRCDLYDELFADWRRIDKAARADSGASRVESLWLSPTVQVQARLF